LSLLTSADEKNNPSHDAKAEPNRQCKLNFFHIKFVKLLFFLPLYFIKFLDSMLFQGERR